MPDKKYKSPQDLALPFREEQILGSEDVAVMNWYYEGDKEKPAILFFHGNTGQIADFAPALVPIIKAGYPVLAMEYRNFGNTAGKISKDALFQDATNAYDFLKSKGHTHIVAYGYSFGGAFASALTSLRPVDGLILTAPFFSLKKIVSEKPVPLARFLLKDSYPSYSYIQSYKGPLLIVHGKSDPVIPYHHSQDLFAQSQSPSKQLHLLDNENHVSLFWNQKNIPFILKFLKDLPKNP
ncbi:MAG: alpha/beta fold hydrolase [Alphaproteobacteria bacterium]|nr:alpha/beta fold hydrolase [Alphaproteobacteria bacterium]